MNDLDRLAKLVEQEGGAEKPTTDGIHPAPKTEQMSPGEREHEKAEVKIGMAIKALVKEAKSKTGDEAILRAFDEIGDQVDELLDMHSKPEFDPLKTMGKGDRTQPESAISAASQPTGMRNTPPWNPSSTN